MLYPRFKIIIGFAVYYVCMAAVISWVAWPDMFSRASLAGVSRSKSDTENFVVERMRECARSGDTGCYRESVPLFLNETSLKDILEIFARHETEPEFFTHCHETAHYLGREAYRRLGSVRAVFAQASPRCLGGVFHGAVEGYLIEKKIPFDGENDVLVAGEIPKICGVLKEYAIPQHFVECHHGLGHAAMFFTDNDLVRGLKLCDALPDTGLQGLCYSGVFMANADGTNSKDHPSKYGVKLEEPFYPCTILEERYQSQCYTYGTLVLYQKDLQKSIAICTGVPLQYRSACFQTIGRDRTMVSADPHELKTQCDKIADTRFRNDCIKGVAYNLFIRFGADSPLSFRFCAIADVKSKDDCYRSASSALGTITRDPRLRQRACGIIQENEYAKYCTL